MSDLAQYAQERAEEADNTRCSVCLLPPELRAQVDEALRSRSAPTTIIRDWLESKGHPLPLQRLYNHKNRGGHHLA